MHFKDILFQKQDDIAIITLNRPDTRNTINKSLNFMTISLPKNFFNFIILPV